MTKTRHRWLRTCVRKKTKKKEDDEVIKEQKYTNSIRKRPQHIIIGKTERRRMTKAPDIDG